MNWQVIIVKKYAWACMHAICKMHASYEISKDQQYAKFIFHSIETYLIYTYYFPRQHFLARLFRSTTRTKDA